MQSITRAMSGFRPPELTRAQWDSINAQVADYEREQERAKVYYRLKKSRIPEAFKGAKTSNERVRQWVQNPRYGLFLCGKPGVGKTYEACAALKAFAREMTVMFYSVDDLMRDVRASYDTVGDTEQAVMDRAFNVGCLLLDDLGRDNLTAAALPRLFDVIDTRLNRGKLTIITSNDTGSMLRDKFARFDAVTADALASRMSCYAVCVMDGKDRRRENVCA